jgi:hypothetical protein
MVGLIGSLISPFLGRPFFLGLGLLFSTLIGFSLSSIFVEWLSPFFFSGI